MREKTVKLCTQTVEILSWLVGGLISGLLPLIFIPISTFFIGELFYGVPLLTFRNGSKVKWCVAGSDCKFMVEPWKDHIFLTLGFRLVILSLNLCYFYFKCC